MKYPDLVVIRGSTAQRYTLEKCRAKPNPSSGPLRRFQGARWVPLTNGKRGNARAWNPLLIKYEHASGVYVLRDRATKRVIYVGESHTGRLYRTLLRHFHDSSGNFERLGEWVHHAPASLEVMLFRTKAADALELEAEAVQYYEPLVNKPVSDDDDFKEF